jgi:hypothetical protein
MFRISGTGHLGQGLQDKTYTHDGENMIADRTKGTKELSTRMLGWDKWHRKAGEDSPDGTGRVGKRGQVVRT